MNKLKMTGQPECFLCGATDNLQIHHIDFDHKNNKADNRIILCHRCHSELHKVGYLPLDALKWIQKKYQERKAMLS